MKVACFGIIAMVPLFVTQFVSWNADGGMAGRKLELFMVLEKLVYGCWMCCFGSILFVCCVCCHTARRVEMTGYVVSPPFHAHKLHIYCLNCSILKDVEG